MSEGNKIKEIDETAIEIVKLVTTANIMKACQVIESLMRDEDPEKTKKFVADFRYFMEEDLKNLEIELLCM